MICLRPHKGKPAIDPHSQCLCYRTSPQDTTALRQQDFTDWSLYHWVKHKPFFQPWHFNNINLDEELPAVWEKQELRSSIAAFKNYIPFLIWDLHPEQPPPTSLGPQSISAGSLLARLHALLRPGSFHQSCTDGHTVCISVVINSDTQQQHTD